LKAHDHVHTSQRPQSALILAAGLTGFTFVVELAGGLWSNSVALLSDAGHAFTDLSALLFSLFAVRLARRPASDRRTFGLHRLEVFAAFLNGLLICAMAVWIIAESFGRFGSPPAIKLGPMFGVAAWGLACNVYVAWKLHGFADADVNLRGAFLHVVSDALASVGVVAGAALIRLTGRVEIDAAVGLFVGAVIFLNAFRLIKDSVEILLEGVPKHIDLAQVVRAMREVPGVTGVEDTHVWNICSHLCSLSAHVTVADDKMADQRRVIDGINAVLRQRFAIAHSTIQIHSSSWEK
jgi:cobalt-zinc-cadmium efflux system protein